MTSATPLPVSPLRPSAPAGVVGRKPRHVGGLIVDAGWPSELYLPRPTAGIRALRQDRRRLDLTREDRWQESRLPGGETIDMLLLESKRHRLSQRRLKGGSDEDQLAPTEKTGS